MFHQSKLGRELESQYTHIFLIKSQKEVYYIKIISQISGLKFHLKGWYQYATSVPYIHLVVGFTPKTVDSHSYCFNKKTLTTKYFIEANWEEI